MEVVKISDPELLLVGARETLFSFFLENKDKAILFLVSGGSSLEILSDLDSTHLGANVTIGVLDERYDQSPDINNFAQLTKTKFYEKVKERNIKFIDTRPGAVESLEELAVRFEESLKTWRRDNPDGKVVITQGIGEDGHTAGIMPYPEDPDSFNMLFEGQGEWVAGYDATLAKNPYPLRVTVMLPFLREMVDKSIVYVQGEKKREALTRVLAPEGKIWETPARIVHEMKNAIIFTGIAA